MTYRNLLIISSLFILCSCTSEDRDQEWINKLNKDPAIPAVKQKAIEIVSTGFNAGDNYSEVWIRDFNTFIELALDVHDQEGVKENLRIFFRFQDENGGIVDGFIPYTEDPAGE